MNHKLKKYVVPSECVDSGDPRIIKQAQALVDGLQTDIDQAKALYYFVRDSFYYNPYSASVEPESLKATTVLGAGEGWCVSKAVLLAALCRAVGLPARLGFADVVNHLSTEKLRQRMNTDVFYFHGYCSIYLNDQWVKATPAFNMSMCQKFNLTPLEFDGISDSLYHAFDEDGNRHMEYLHDRGEYLDVPIEEMRTVFAEHYPEMSHDDLNSKKSNSRNSSDSAEQWQKEIDQEMGQ